MDNELKIQAIQVKCASFQAQLDLFVEFLSSESPCPDETEVRYTNILPLLDRYSRASQEMLQIDASSSTKFAEFEHQCFQALAKAKLITNSRPQVPQNQNSLVTNPAKSSFPSHQTPADLPRFDGDFEKYSSFMDMFEALVNRNTALLPIQKFYYLRSALIGEAADLVNTIPFASNNYESALATLKNQYKNEKFKIHHQIIKTLYDLPKMPPDDFKTIKYVSFHFSQAIDKLKALNLTPAEKDPFLSYLIISKFDEGTLRKWESNDSSRGLPKWNQLLDFLQSQSQIVSSVNYNLTNRNLETAKNNLSYRGVAMIRDRIQRNRDRTSQTLFAATRGRTSKKSLEFKNMMDCYLCEQKHSLFKCLRFLSLSVSDRIDTIKRLRICGNCFNKSHSAQECQRSSCRKCNERHNTLIHH